MKHGKRPTIKQKQLIKGAGLSPENWLVVKFLPDEMHIVHRYTNQERIITY